MAMRKKTGNTNSKPPASAKEPIDDRIERKTQEILRLHNADIFTEDKCMELVGLMEQSKDNMSIIAKFLSNDNPKVRDRAMKVFVRASGNGIDISDSAPAVANALMDEKNWIRSMAATTLAFMAMSGVNASNYVPALVSALSDSVWGVRDAAGGALKCAVRNGDAETREKIISEIMRFMNYERFKAEMAQNSQLYSETIERLATIIHVIDQAEREAA